MRNKERLEQIKQNWGKPKEDHFPMQLIEDFFLWKEEVSTPYLLADRTIDDLDFLAFFKFLDRTTSVIGQQYLYYHLRYLKPTPNALNELEQRIAGCTENEAKRIDLQRILHELSTSNDYYFPFLIYGELPPKLTFYWLIKVLQIATFVGVLLAIVNPVFVIPLLLLFSLNMLLHFWHKNRLGNFATIFSRLINSTLRLSKKH